jgi:hypothetical protein
MPRTPKQPEGKHIHATEQELAEALDKYTDPSHLEFDPKFDKEIRASRPDWFEEKHKLA